MDNNLNPKNIWKPSLAMHALSWVNHIQKNAQLIKIKNDKGFMYGLALKTATDQDIRDDFAGKDVGDAYYLHDVFNTGKIEVITNIDQMSDINPDWYITDMHEPYGILRNWLDPNPRECLTILNGEYPEHWTEGYIPKNAKEISKKYLDFLSDLYFFRESNFVYNSNTLELAKSKFYGYEIILSSKIPTNLDKCIFIELTSNNLFIRELFPSFETAHRFGASEI